MLGKYLKINGETMPNPVSFDDNFVADENVFKTESGKRKTNIIRLDRYTFTATFQCTSVLKDKLDTLCKTASVTVQVGTAAAVTGTLRRASGGSLVENSQNCQGTDGLWTVSVIFEGD